MSFYMNTTPIVIKQFEQENTTITKYFNEPASPNGKVYGPDILLDAQINFNSTRARKYLDIRDDIAIDGYLIIEKEQLDNLGIELKDGDLIIKIGSKDYNLKIIKINEEAELLTINDYAEPTLVYVGFVNNKKKIGGVI